MKLFTKEEINKNRKDQTRELMIKNDRLIASNRKILSLQKDIEFDADKAKKVKEYEVWCADLQTKMGKELKNLTAYQKLVEDEKEKYYKLIQSVDALEDKLIDGQEELSRLDLQISLKKSILEKNHA